MKPISHTSRSDVSTAPYIKPPSSFQQSLPFVLGLPFIWIVSLSSASTVKFVTLALGIAAIAVAIAAFRGMRERLQLPFILLFSFVFVDGISTFYALSGKFALYEYLKVLCAFCLAILLTALSPRDARRTGRWIASLLTTAAAVASLVSIDLISTHWISDPFLKFLSCFTGDYIELTGLSVNTRINSLFENPNIFAGVSGIAVLLGLGLTVSAEQAKGKPIHLVLLYINALAFLLAFSRAATAAIFAAFVVILAVTRKARRTSLFILMFETLVLCICSAAVISSTSFQSWEKVQPIPLICTAGGAALLCLCDCFLGSRIANIVINRRIVRNSWIFFIGFVISAVIFGILAFTLTGPIHLSANEQLTRSTYPQPGTYTLHVQSDAPMLVIILYQSKSNAIMHTQTELYRGEAKDAVFTVPEDSLVVHITTSSRQDVHLYEFSYSGESGNVSLPLRYRLLPSFIANRLQNLRVNDNLILRLVYFGDGLQLFRRSPIIGLGMGSFENAVKSVQSFYYETKYAHNHYIQVMAETGIVGLLVFLGLFGVSFWALLRGRKAENADPLIPALSAALVFMMLHGFWEIVFSSYAYLPFAFGVFTIINVTCGSSLPQVGKRVRTVLLPVMLLWIVIYTVLLGQNIQAAKLVREERSMDSLVKAVEMDRFEWADYALSYVYSAGNPDAGATTRYHADRFAEHLSKVDSNTIPIYLAEYYFQTDRLEPAFQMIDKYINYIASDEEGWQRAFTLMENYSQNTDEYRKQVLYIADMMDTWNAEHMGTLTLSAESQAFINDLREQSANHTVLEPVV